MYRQSSGSASVPWRPRYAVTPAAARALMEIEAARAAVEGMAIPPAAEVALRVKARLSSAHYSTRIEGNRLTLGEAKKAIERRRVLFRGRLRDASEVRHYWDALGRIETWAARGAAFTEPLMRRVHGFVMRGPRAAPTPYRDGQNAIRDAVSGALVYLPPEAKDVPLLMAMLARWVRESERERLPSPILAGLVHYQFVTIHPFYDGNGRTARLLTTFLLQRGGYGLHGFLSVEEHHARDLEGYYRALATHPHHNYYEGRAAADISGWVEYFAGTLAAVFREAKTAAERLAESRPRPPSGVPTRDPRARLVLALFASADRVTGPQVARALGLSDRMARLILNRWVKEGWLRVLDPSNRKRAYGLKAAAGPREAGE